MDPVTAAPAAGEKETDGADHGGGPYPFGRGKLLRAIEIRWIGGGHVGTAAVAVECQHPGS